MISITINYFTKTKNINLIKGDFVKQNIFTIIIIFFCLFLFTACNDLPSPQRLILDTENVKTTYEIGEMLDLNNLKVYALMDDTKTVDITDKTTIKTSQFSETIAGFYRITIFYKHLHNSFLVEVKPTMPNEDKHNYNIPENLTNNQGVLQSHDEN